MISYTLSGLPTLWIKNDHYTLLIEEFKKDV